VEFLFSVLYVGYRLQDGTGARRCLINLARAVPWCDVMSINLTFQAWCLYFYSKHKCNTLEIKRISSLFLLIKLKQWQLSEAAVSANGTVARHSGNRSQLRIHIMLHSNSVSASVNTWKPLGQLLVCPFDVLFYGGQCWEDVIGQGCEGVEWIHLAQHRVHQTAALKAIRKGDIRFSRRRVWCWLSSGLMSCVV
jgi:hypothetical protein